MIKCYCDRCGNEINNSYPKMLICGKIESFDKEMEKFGNLKRHICHKCFKKLKIWLLNKDGIKR